MIIPTIGRERLLERCLRSVLACSPAPAEIVVVDQGHERVVATCVARAVAGSPGTPAPVRVVRCDGTGIARATNDGLRHARHATVMVTHDDCTVAADWVSAAWSAHLRSPGGIVTGRVLPVGDPALVPSTITATTPRDWTGVRAKGALYPQNMIADGDALLAIGGFDERPTLRRAAEDNDLCYRWAKAGRDLRYDPDLVVWHHDWRSPADLRATYRTYAKGQGAFYAKHLAAGDLFVLRFVASDVGEGLRARLRRARRSRWHAPPTRRDQVLPWLFVGLAAGWREARQLSRAAASRAA